MSPPSWPSLPPPTLSHLSRLLQSPSLSSLSHSANSHWLSLLPMVVYMLPCHSVHSSYPPYYPCPLVSPLCLCLHCCPANRFISTIFLDSVYMYIWYLFFSFWPTSLCIIGSRFIHLIRTDSNMSFLWPSSIPLYICTTASLSWMLGNVLLWAQPMRILGIYHENIFFREICICFCQEVCATHQGCDLNFLRDPRFSIFI